MPRKDRPRTQAPSRALWICVATMLLLIATATTRVQAVCSADPLDGSTVYFSETPGADLCGSLTTTFLTCTKLGEAVDKLATDSGNVSVVTMCTNVTLGTDTTQDQPGIPSDIAHVWITTANVQRKKLNCITSDHGADGRPVCRIFVDAVTKRSVMTFTFVNAGMEDIAIVRTHPALADIYPPPLWEVNDVIFDARLSSVLPYESLFISFLRDVDPSSEREHGRSGAGAGVGKPFKSYASAQREVEASLVSNKPLGRDNRVRYALNGESPGSPTTEQISRAILGDESLSFAEHYSPASAVSAESHKEGEDGKKKKVKRAPEQVTLFPYDPMDIDYVKGCAYPNSTTICNQFDVQLINVDFRQDDILGGRKVDHHTSFAPGSSYYMIVIRDCRFGYFAEEVSCEESASYQLVDAVYQYTNITLFHLELFSFNDLVYAELDVQYIAGLPQNPVMVDVNGQYNFYDPRPYEIPGGVLSPLVLWLVDDACDYNPYYVLPLASTPAAENYPGPVFVTDDMGNRSGYCTIGIAIDLNTVAKRRVTVEVTAHVYTITETVVVDYPTTICSMYLPKVHGDKFPILYADLNNPCLPAIASFSYVLYLADINIKLADGNRGVSFHDNATTFADLVATWGNECNLVVVNNFLANISSFEAANNADFFGPAWLGDPLPANWSNTIEIGGVISKNVVVQGGSWAFNMIANQTTADVIIQQSIFVGQSAKGVSVRNLQGLRIQDNSFLYVYVEDSFRWSANRATQPPIYLNTPSPNNTLPFTFNNAPLILTNVRKAVVEKNAYYQGRTVGILVNSGEDILIDSNSFAQYNGGGILAQCVDGTSPLTPSPTCVDASAVLVFVQGVLEASVPGMNCSQFLDAFDDQTNETLFGQNPVVQTLYSVLSTVTIGDVPNAAYVVAHSNQTLISVLQVILMSCSANLRSFNIDYTVYEVLDPALPCGAYDQLELYQQLLANNGACEFPVMSIFAVRDLTTIVSAPVVSPSVPFVCTEKIPGLVVTRNTYTKTELVLTILFDPIDVLADNVAAPTQGASRPFNLQIDIPNNGASFSTPYPLTLFTDLSIDSLFVFVSKNDVQDQLGLCVARGLDVWRSFVYWVSLPFHEDSYVISLKAIVSNVLTVASDIKRPDLQSEVLQWRRSQDELAGLLPPGNPPLPNNASVCPETQLSSRDSWETRLYGCDQPGAVPDSCRSWTDYNSTFDAPGCDLAFSPSVFTSQFALTLNAPVVPPTNITIIVDCNRLDAWTNDTDGDEITLVVYTFADAIFIVKSYNESDLAGATVTIEYFGLCRECILFSNITYVGITVKPLEIPGAKSFIVHPLECKNNVIVEFCTNITFQDVEFRTDMRGLEDSVGVSSLMFSAFSAHYDDNSHDEEPLHKTGPPRGKKPAVPQQQRALQHPYEANAPYKRGMETHYSMRSRALLDDIPTLYNPQNESLVDINDFARSSGCREIPHDLRNLTSYHRSYYFDTVSGIVVTGNSFAGYNLIEAIGMIFSTNVTIEKSVFTQQVQGITWYADQFMAEIKDVLESSYSLDKRGVAELRLIWAVNNNVFRNNTFVLNRNAISVRTCVHSVKLINPDVFLKASENLVFATEGTGIAISDVEYLAEMEAGSDHNKFYAVTNDVADAVKILAESGVVGMSLDYPLFNAPVGSFYTLPLVQDPNDIIADNRNSATHSAAIAFDGSFLKSESDFYAPNSHGQDITFKVGSGVFRNATVSNGTNVYFDRPTKLLQTYGLINVTDSLFDALANVSVTTNGFKQLVSFKNVRIQPNLLEVRTNDPCRQTLSDVLFDNVTHVVTGEALYHGPPDEGFVLVNNFIDARNRTLVECHDYHEYVFRAQGCFCVDIGNSFYISEDNTVVSFVASGLHRGPKTRALPSNAQKKIACGGFNMSQIDDGRRSCVLPNFVTPTPTPTPTPVTSTTPVVSTTPVTSITPVTSTSLAPSGSLPPSVTPSNVPTPTPTHSPSKTPTKTPTPKPIYKPEDAPWELWLVVGILLGIVVLGLLGLFVFIVIRKKREGTSAVPSGSRSHRSKRTGRYTSSVPSTSRQARFTEDEQDDGQSAVETTPFLAKDDDLFG